jgi:5-methylcytosine-specific restriction protein A
MGLRDLTPKSVEAALREAEKLGRDAFLERYGFAHARQYFVKWNGHQYDSKAIAGAAHGNLPGLQPLTHDEFSGGEATVAATLEALGFEMAEMQHRNPDWTRDELILALDVYVRFKGNPPGKGSQEILELSRIVNGIWGSDRSGRREDFRNANGVYMKLMNFRRFDPAYQEQGKAGLKRGNKLEEEVWADFASNPDRLARVAAAIKANLESATFDTSDPEDVEEAEEGRVLTRAHQVRERSRKLVEAKKSASRKAHGKLACEACTFEFAHAYGERGREFMEVHHALPVYQLTPGAKTRLSDLHLLCSNCHRMVHAKRPWLTLTELQNCLREAKSNSCVIA